MVTRIADIYDFIAYYEQKVGDLNLFFYYIYDNEVSHNELMEMLFVYDKMKGFEIDYEEYLARFGDRSFEFILEKVKVVAKDIAIAMKDKDRYIPRYK